MGSDLRQVKSNENLEWVLKKILENYGANEFLSRAYDLCSI